MKFFEFEFLSNHYHLLAYDRTGKITDFLRELNSTIARELNAIRGEKGKFFVDDPGIQTVLGGERIFEHSIYTLANAVAAGLVHKPRSAGRLTGRGSRRRAQTVGGAGGPERERWRRANPRRVA